MRISSVVGVSHQGCGGGGGASFEMSYGSVPARRTCAERTIVANTALPKINNLIFIWPILSSPTLKSEKLINQFLLYLLRCVYRTLVLCQRCADDLGFQKNRPPDERRPIDLTNLTNLPLRLEVESHTRAD